MREDASEKSQRSLSVLSIVEALTVTGPVKPLLMFSALARREGTLRRHSLMTTRRTPAGAADDRDELRTAIVREGIEYFPIYEKRAFDPGVLTAMAKVLRDIRPSLVETHDCKSHLLFWLLRLRHPEFRRLAWIAFHHGYTRTSWKMTLYQQLDRLTLRRATQVVTLCKPFAAVLARRGVSPANLDVITNALAPRERPSPAELARVRADLHIDPRELVMVVVGRLSQEKGQADLIHAFIALSAAVSEPRLRLLLIGDGPDRPALEALAQPAGARIVFAGYSANPWPLFNAADIFVLPSHSEGSPLVVLEAMDAGLPIVATRVGGVPEVLIHEETALLVNPSEPAALRNALERLVRDPALRAALGRHARETLPRYSPESYVARLLGIYDAASRRVQNS